MLDIVPLELIPKCLPVSCEEPVQVFKTCQDLQELCDQKGGIGISAAQAGLPIRLFLVKGDGTCPYLPKDEYGFFVNCDYHPVMDGVIVSREGCLSLKDGRGRIRLFHVDRYASIQVIGKKLEVANGVLTFVDIDWLIGDMEQGIVFQHEIDHDAGRTKMIDRIGTEIYLN